VRTPVTIPDTTALGGALVQRPDGWHWRDDGSLEPRVRNMRLRDLAPNWRCATYGSGTYVEIPRGYLRECQDEDVRRVVRELVHGAGRPADIYAEGSAELLDDHRLTRRGYLVPIEAWDALMNEPCGVIWDQSDEAEILARAGRKTEGP